MKKFLVSITIMLSMLTSSFYYANARIICDSETRYLYKEESQVVTVFNARGRNINVTNEDIHLMAQIVYAESCAEPYEGKVAVASVILNRLRDGKFPDNIQGVVKQKAAFSCVRNGKISVTPDENSYRAVMDALRGKDPTENAVFFYNPKIATCSWMKNIDKHNSKTIGNHVFFVVN
jgi:N-acetylmuramoyl-L-alanine amidase